MLPPTPTVESISALHITGNIVPREWLVHLKMSGGKADPIGALVLAEIVFWYRWTLVERPTPHYERRFRGDKLQKSYQQLSASLGFSKQQLRSALDRLEAAGYIRRELRNVTTPSGARLVNIMFLEPVPEAIERITVGRTIGRGPVSKTARQVEYKAYLATPYWRALREEILAVQPFCQQCGAVERLNIHHLYYYKDGQSVLYHEREFPNVLTVLCRPCHQEKHTK